MRDFLCVVFLKVANWILNGSELKVNGKETASRWHKILEPTDAFRNASFLPAAFSSNRPLLEKYVYTRLDLLSCVGIQSKARPAQPITFPVVSSLPFFLSLPLNEFQPASFPFLFSISIFGSFIPSRFSYLFFLACLVQNRLSSSVFACRSFPFPMPYIYNPPYPLYHILQISRVC